MEKTKTNEKITITLSNGKQVKKSIYINESGEKFVYNQRGFFTLDYFLRNRTN